MIFYKVAGSVMLILCSSLLAAYKNREIERQIDELDAFGAFLRQVKMQIECFGLPITEILWRCDEEILYNCGYKGESRPRELCEFVAGCKVSGEPLGNMLKGFSSEFGRGYRDEEIRLCEYYLLLAREERERLKSSLPSKKKLNVTLPLALAAALIILLI